MELLVKSITAPMPTLIPRPLILFKGAVGRRVFDSFDSALMAVTPQKPFINPASSMIKEDE